MTGRRNRAAETAGAPGGAQDGDVTGRPQAPDPGGTAAEPAVMQGFYWERHSASAEMVHAIAPGVPSECPLLPRCDRA